MEYSLFRVITCYSLLVLSVILLILYIIYYFKRKDLIKQSLRRIDACFSLASGVIAKSQKGELVSSDIDNLKKIVISLEYNKNDYLLLKERTSLDDFAKLIEIVDKTIREVRDLRYTAKQETMTQKVESIKNNLLKQKEKLQYLVTLVK